MVRSQGTTVTHVQSCAARRGTTPADRASQPPLLRGGQAGNLRQGLRPTPRRAEKDRRRSPELVTPDSPTQRVGGEPIEASSPSGTRPMLSIDNTYSSDDCGSTTGSQAACGRRVFTWSSSRSTASPCRLRMKRTFHPGRHRGDGSRGDDVAQSKTIRDAAAARRKSRQSCSGAASLHATCGSRQLDRERQKAGLEPYASTRNTTAGSLKLLDPKLSAQRRLRFFGCRLARGRRRFARGGDARPAAKIRLPGQRAHRHFGSIEASSNTATPGPIAARSWLTTPTGWSPR